MISLDIEPVPTAYRSHNVTADCVKEGIQLYTK